MADAADRRARLLVAVAAVCLLLATLPPAAAPGAEAQVEDLGRELRDAWDAGAGSSGRRHEFYFTRAIYSSGGRRGGWRWRRGSWSTDYPKADRQFLFGLRRLTIIDAYEAENPVRLDDPRLHRYPFVYALEVGFMSLTDAEVEGLRRFLRAGGFLMVDDFWGTYEWQNFEAEMRRVLPDRGWREMPPDHPVFSTFYRIDEIVQVPEVSRGRRGLPTWERDGYVPHCRGFFDDDGRLMVLVNWNTDLGDAWEWVDDPWYPLRYSNFAYQLGINAIVYAMTH